MGSPKDEQLQELEALLSVFDERRVKFSEIDDLIKGSILIEFEPLSSPCELVILDNNVRRSVRLNVLPPTTLQFELPTDYPSTSSPNFSIECIWMSVQTLENLKTVLRQECENMIGMPMLFLCCQAILDFIHDLHYESKEIYLDEIPYIISKNLTPKEALKIASDMSEITENYNFETGCYDCEICFDNKSGKDCVRISPCNHVYCFECVKGYVVEKTRGGKMVAAITCLDANCDSSISQVIIKRCIGEEEFERYEKIVLEVALCQMNDVVTCPRLTCQLSVIINPDNPRLGVCTCGYAFCVLCKKTYHGLNACDVFKLPSTLKQLDEETGEEFTYDRDEIVRLWNTGDEKKRTAMAKWYGGYLRLQQFVDTCQNEDWIENNSKPCPKCATAIEKNMGCNKMICTKCRVKFCWLCNQILHGDPYAHFRSGDCANKLFHGTYEEEVPEPQEDQPLDRIVFRELWNEERENMILNIMNDLLQD